MAWTTPKTFTAGERLFAQDLNTYVSDNLADLDLRTVKSFADSSARTTAIPSPATGAVTFLEDTDAVEVYDGSAWVGISPDVTLPSGTAIYQTADQDNTSSSFNTVTNFDVDVTPSSATSQILVVVNFQMKSISDFGVLHEVQLRRDTTALATTQTSTVSAIFYAQSGSIVYLDTPGTTSTVNYNVRFRGVLNQSRGSRIQNRQLVAVELPQ